MPQVVDVVCKEISDQCPRASKEFGEYIGDGKIFVDQEKKSLEVKPLRKHHEHNQRQKHGHVDDDQLCVRVVGSYKGVFKFVKHKSNIFSFSPINLIDPPQFGQY